MWQLAGAISVVSLIAGLSAMALLRPLGWHQTFSRHAAQSSQLTYYYALLFMVTFVPMAIVWQFHIIPVYSLPTAFSVLIWLATFTQIACTFIPDTGGQHSILHLILAGTSAASLALLVTLLIVTISDQATTPWLWAGMALMACAAIMWGIKVNRYLILQAIFYLGYILIFLRLLF